MRICTLNVQLSRTEYVCLIFGMISLIYFLIPKGEGYFGSDVAKLCTAGVTFDCFSRNSKGLFASISTMNLMFGGALEIADDDDEEMYRKSNLLSVVCKELACIGFITIFSGWFIVRQISESRIREPHEFGANILRGNHHKAYFWYTPSVNEARPSQRNFRWDPFGVAKKKWKPVPVEKPDGDVSIRAASKPAVNRRRIRL